MMTNERWNASDDVYEPAISLRYGEAASYRSSQWLQVKPRNEWLADKSRNVWPFTRLFKMIDESSALLELPDDWDDAGSSAIDSKTWERATNWIKDHAAKLWGRFGIILPEPRIMPGPDGSIDIHWKTANRELLLNVPAGTSEPANFYGDDFGSDKRKGTIEPGSFDMDLFSWLTVTD
jgi:hypothetical protein